MSLRRMLEMEQGIVKKNLALYQKCYLKKFKQLMQNSTR